MINAELTSAIYKAIDEWEITGDPVSLDLFNFVIRHPEKQMQLGVGINFDKPAFGARYVSSGRVAGKVDGQEWFSDLTAQEAQAIHNRISAELSKRNQVEAQRQRLENERAMAKFAAALMA